MVFSCASTRPLNVAELCDLVLLFAFQADLLIIFSQLNVIHKKRYFLAIYTFL